MVSHVITHSLSSVNLLLVPPGEKAEELLVFRESSEMARRGKCKLCGTFLVLDYEWFEPHTVCLVRPVWREVSEQRPEGQSQLIF